MRLRRRPEFDCDDCIQKQSEATVAAIWRQKKLQAQRVRSWLQDAPIFSTELLEDARQRYETHTQSDDPDVRRDWSETDSPMTDVLELEHAVSLLAPIVGETDGSWTDDNSRGRVRTYVDVEFADVFAGLPREHANVLSRIHTSFYGDPNTPSKCFWLGSVYRDPGGSTVILWAPEPASSVRRRHRGGG